MIHNILNLLSIKLVQNGYCNGSISESGQKSNSPVSRVTTTDRNLVALNYTTVLKQYMDLLDFACNVVKLERYALIISKGILVPVLHYGFFY